MADSDDSTTVTSSAATSESHSDSSEDELEDDLNRHLGTIEAEANALLGQDHVQLALDKYTSLNSREQHRYEENKEDYRLSLFASGALMPHPDKILKGGEDACFVSPLTNTIGVADGVGGWGRSGNSALYSKLLMQNAKAVAEYEIGKYPKEIIHSAHMRVPKDLLGSSTAIIAKLEDEVLHSAHVGDSSVIVIRFEEDSDDFFNPVIVLRSQEQQRGFNFPCQLGYGSNDSAKDAVVTKTAVQVGDIIVMATDGLFDNIFDCELAAIIGSKIDNDPYNIACYLAKKAQLYGKLRNKCTPFAVHARDGKHTRRVGGKLDDVTVIIARVVVGDNVEVVPSNIIPAYCSVSTSLSDDEEEGSGTTEDSTLSGGTSSNTSTT